MSLLFSPFAVIMPTALFKRSQIQSLPRPSLDGAAADQKTGPAYVVIQRKVYDVQDFVSAHPGGNVILTYVNDVFNAFHPESAHEVLANFYVGDLDESKVQAQTAAANTIDEFSEEVGRLREEFKRDGLFESNKLYYAFKIVTNWSILAASVTLTIKYGSTAVLPTLAGAVLMGLFWQQSGWLSHDFLHHQVFDNRSANNAMGYLLGSLGLGFSVGWWKSKHNTHHAVPNTHHVDPDIETLPFLAWSRHILEDASPMMPWARKAMLVYQAYTYFVLLMFARLAWALSSARFAISSWEKAPADALCLGIHWLWYLSLLCTTMSPWMAAGYFMVSQVSGGLFLAAVFSLNHNGMPIYTPTESEHHGFYRMQVLTGRDVIPGLFADWFTGGLNYQIEHHLFPAMPRHNFHKVQPRVEQLCKRFNVPYHQTSFVDGTSEVLARLRDVGATAQERFSSKTKIL